MSRGNDGNLLQHGIEAEIAVHLASEGRLHLVWTHGMEPFEPWENPGRNDRLVHWIRQAATVPSAEDPQ